MTATVSLARKTHPPARPLLEVLARASSPAERIHGGWLRPTGRSTVAQERLMRWSQRVADGRPERMAEVLEEHGLTLDQWLIGLGDVTAVAGEPLPGWAQDAAVLLDLVGTHSGTEVAPSLREVAGDGLPSWVDAEQPWRFHAGFRDWMAVARRDVDTWAAFAPMSDRARYDLVLDLARRQLVVSGPLLMEAATRRPLADPLFASDPRRDWESLWSSHPVVARLLATVWQQWRDSTAELCARIAADLPAVRPGAAVTGIELAAGDQHGKGRGVARLRLDDETSVFLKPRADGLQRLLGAVLGQVDAVGTPLGLRLPEIVERDGYAWALEVRSGDCPDDAAVEAYFRRAGALLRVAQALGSTDLHHENFVPTTDQPVLVDLETVVSPGLLRSGPPEDAVATRLSDTPGPTSMVTSAVAGPPGRVVADIGALAGPTEALTPYAVRTLVQQEGEPSLRNERIPLLNGNALPRRDGAPVPLRGHEQALIEGYAEAQRRLELLSGTDLVPHLQPEPAVRFVARPTRTYARLLVQSTAAEALVDGAERELVLERLYRATGTAPPGLIPCEVEAMRDLDVPLFTVPFTGTELVGDGGTILPDVLRVAPDVRTRTGLRAASSRDDHVADLRATVFTLNPDEGAPTGSRTLAEVDRVDVGEIVDLLLDRAIDVGGGALAWIGLEHDPNRNRWTYGRMSAGLTGQAGIGLTLATVAARAAHVPAGCATAARAALLGSVDRSGRPGPGPADAFGGPAGVLYAAAVAARLLDDGVLLDAARSLVAPCLAAARRNEPSVVIDGAAGAVLALLHLPEDPAVADVLTELAELAVAAPDVDVDPPDSWSRSLPSRACGRALAAHRLGSSRGAAGPIGLPAPAGPGDAVARAAAGVPVHPGGPVGADASYRALLDEAVLAQAAVRSGGDGRWGRRLDGLVEALVTRRAYSGQWFNSLLAPDSAWLSPIHGLAALPALCDHLGPDVPIARALT